MEEWLLALFDRPNHVRRIRLQVGPDQNRRGGKLVSEWALRRINRQQKPSEVVGLVPFAPPEPLLCKLRAVDLYGCRYNLLRPSSGRPNSILSASEKGIRRADLARH